LLQRRGGPRVINAKGAAVKGSTVQRVYASGASVLQMRDTRHASRSYARSGALRARNARARLRGAVPGNVAANAAHI